MQEVKSDEVIRTGNQRNIQMQQQLYGVMVDRRNSSKEHEKHYGYLTKNEILSEIEMLSNKHKGEEYNEKMMIDINVDVGEEAAKMRNSLKEKNKYDNNLTFGKYKDIKISIK